MEYFRSAVATSKLCQPDTWQLDIDEMAALQDCEINGLLDQLLPPRQVVRRQRTSDPSFNKEYCDAKIKLGLVDLNVSMTSLVAGPLRLLMARFVHLWVLMT